MNRSHRRSKSLAKAASVVSNEQSFWGSDCVGSPGAERRLIEPVLILIDRIGLVPV